MRRKKKKKKEKQNKRKADRLEEKSAGNGAGLARLMQGRCGGKCRQGNRAKHRKHSKGGQRLQETVLGFYSLHDCRSAVYVTSGLIGSGVYKHD